MYVFICVTIVILASSLALEKANFLSNHCSAGLVLPPGRPGWACGETANLPASARGFKGAGAAKPLAGQG
jgi:hypothetical protein